LVLVSFGAYLIITKFLSAERNGIVSTTDSSSLAKVVGPGQDTTSPLPMQRRAVSIQTVPAGGSIKVDSVGGGLSPLTLPGVTPGTYRVQADLPGHEPYLGEIQVEPAAAGQAGPLVVRLPMQRSTSQVRVTSDPVGLAYVMTGPNGAIRRGKTPALEDQLPTGIWEYTVSREGFDAQRGSINVKRGEVAQIQADLADGQLSIDSTPQGAEVWTAGARLGVTPLEISQVSPGPRDFELRLAGYERKVLATEVRAREATRELVVLQRRPYPTAGQKWENSLGMRFLPVPGMSVLVSVWETREQDYGAFVRATNRGGRAGQAESQAASHPVVEVSWDDARAFCEWLTEKERREGQLTARQRYRLPTDAEWSIAVGLDESGSGSPKDKDGRIKDVFPWGQVWPPPHGAGNYSPILAVDNFEGLAPVGSFAANQHGLHDLGGNVWEWCEDWYDPSTRQVRVLRGASYSRFARDYLLSSYRSFDAPNVRDLYTGFRCVLDAGEVD
jgi:formylglycine-generating enzyme required for sulfatase activity